MGVSLTANNSGYNFDMGYGGFFSLRKNIALAFDKDFGEHYANLIYCQNIKDFEKHDEIAEWILNKNKLTDEDQDIVDFLYAPDSGGKITYRTCGKIYGLSKDVEFDGKTFVYGALSDGKDYHYLKEFLKECYSRRRNAYWY